MSETGKLATRYMSRSQETPSVFSLYAKKANERRLSFKHFKLDKPKICVQILEVHRIFWWKVSAIPSMLYDM